MRKWLADGEQVQLVCRPHSRILVWPITVGLVLVMAASAGLAKLQPAQFYAWAPDVPQLRQPAIVLLLTAAVLLLVGYPLRRVVRWANTSYVLTSQRVVVRRGRLRRQQEDYYLARVESLDMRQRLRQRVVGAGDLQFHLVAGGVRTVHDVPHIQEFRNHTHRVWTQLLRASFQQAPGAGYYADEVGSDEDGMRRHLTGKELRRLGRDN
ncbi:MULTISPECIES: PH domain-containing protein [unclassified Arthrobacter]|uniref:PH domain-containing protein n=1 Tax=unclassified Arthrobacter TaxID=235627 RepID=UPI00159E6813|nr:MULTISPECIES: PH domain-containing protein [unclassified Arthrobacter]MCQ9163397.1 PH domain-containing protein [Arthrobacter sp. STN4]NVM97595.1 PH domain-containing protein [Arthrobacter sp. SDTb3-6]